MIAKVASTADEVNGNGIDVIDNSIVVFNAKPSYFPNFKLHALTSLCDLALPLLTS